MKIKILRPIAIRGQAFTPGSEIEIDEKTARAWLRAGLVELVKVVEPSEVKADVRPRKSKRKR
ncbi:hypothetical protein [Atrimonas thermophila]|uniref:hypothetical protein n=1 Tax=Atrimonas thermophila TaxID=3064161 RepID=UPI00399D1EC7